MAKTRLYGIDKEFFSLNKDDFVSSYDNSDAPVFRTWLKYEYNKDGSLAAPDVYRFYGVLETDLDDTPWLPVRMFDCSNGLKKIGDKMPPGCRSVPTYAPIIRESKTKPGRYERDWSNDPLASLVELAQYNNYDGKIRAKTVVIGACVVDRTYVNSEGETVTVEQEPSILELTQTQYAALLDKVEEWAEEMGVKPEDFPISDYDITMFKRRKASGPASLVIRKTKRVGEWEYSEPYNLHDHVEDVRSRVDTWVVENADEHMREAYVKALAACHLKLGRPPEEVDAYIAEIGGAEEVDSPSGLDEFKPKSDLDPGDALDIVAEAGTDEIKSALESLGIDLPKRKTRSALFAAATKDDVVVNVASLLAKAAN